MESKKKYRHHIKVYPRTEEEEEIIKAFAYKKGASASSLFLSYMLREIQKEGEK